MLCLIETTPHRAWVGCGGREGRRGEALDQVVMKRWEFGQTKGSVWDASHGKATFSTDVCDVE